jgi:hypothetical protein
MTDWLADGADIAGMAGLCLSVVALQQVNRVTRISQTPDVRVLPLLRGPMTQEELAPWGGGKPGESFDTTVRVQNFGPGAVKDVGFCVDSRGQTVCSSWPMAHILEGTLGPREEFRFFPFFGGNRRPAVGDTIEAVVFGKDVSGHLHVCGPDRHKRRRRRVPRVKKFTAQKAFKMIYGKNPSQSDATMIAESTKPKVIGPE